jgi:hypothetical protein
LNLPDDVSLKFGNDGDLEIFHKADTYSRIKDNGTGALQLSSNRFKVMNSSNNETMIDATQNAGVDLYFDDSKKLETKTDGINVTGDISASGNFILGDLGGGPFISGSQGGLQVSGSGITIHNGSADGVLKIQRFSGDIGQLSAANTRFTIRALSNKNISIEDDAGNVGVFVKDGGKVGIGADTTPTTALQVTGDISASGVIEAQSHISTSGDIRLIGGANNIIFGEPGDTTSQNYGIQTDGNLYLDIDKDNDNTGNFFQFRSNQATTNIMRIKDTGEVGIGTTSPPKTLTVEGDISGSGYISLQGAITASGNYSGSADSTFRIGGKLIAGSKSFVIPRPEGGMLEYGVLEGQQNDVFFRGELKDDNVIHLPKEWEWLVDENTITVQLTSIGKHQELFVKEIKENKIFIDINGMCKGKNDIHCYHIIHGTRKDVELIRNYQ